MTQFKPRHRFALSLICTGLLFGCGSRDQVNNLNGLANGSTGKNAAVIFGAPHGLEGVPTDVREFSKLLKEPQYNFQFPVVASNGDATVAAILALTAETAKNADTLIWYFSGHGNTGIMLASDTTFTFHQVADALKTARLNKPLKRLIVLIDSCYSGSFINGSSPIVEDSVPQRHYKCARPSEPTDAPGSDIFDVLDSMKDRGIFEQAFVMSSSTKDESSVDLGAEKGGAFTWALRQVMADLRQNRDGATLDEFARATTARTQREGDHTPVYKAFPSSLMLNEKMFHYAL